MDAEEHEPCHGCSEYAHRCDELFRCQVCELLKNVCLSQVGGFDDPRSICAPCHFRIYAGKRLVSKYARHTSRAWLEEGRA